MSTTNILDLNNRIDELEKNSGGGGSADSAKRSDIATEFSAETSYTAGNFVYHEGKLYQFNVDHSAGAWDPTDVVEANVTDQIVSNASAIAGLTASDVAYDNTDSGLNATKVQGAIDEIVANMGNMRMAKLWENPSPSASFAAGSVQLSSSDYDLLLILTGSSSTNDRKVPATIGNSGYLNFAENSGQSALNEYRGYVASGTTVTFEDAKKTGTTDNTKLIPLAIYGIKLT